MFTSVRRFWRWFRFQTIYKRKFGSSPGIPCLCSNLRHPFHESKFERDTCESLATVLPPIDILVPSQHRLTTKFDFLIPNVGVVEPHGIWGDLSSTNAFLSYYTSRRELADTSGLSELPVVVLANRKDLSTLINNINATSDNQKAFRITSLELLEKYKSKEPEVVYISVVERTWPLVLGFLAVMGWVVVGFLLVLVLAR